MNRTQHHSTRRPVIVTLILALVSGVFAIGTPAVAASNEPPYAACKQTNGTGCITQFGWNRSSTNQAPVAGYPIDPHGNNCTAYAAFRVLQNGPDIQVSGLGNANTWDDRARSRGIPVDNTPAVGAVAQWNTGTYGHVAYVDWVSPDGQRIAISESAYVTDYSPSYSARRILTKGTSAWPENFIHFKDMPGGITNGSFVRYDGNIYRIAGGAPLYVSSWSVFGGPQPTTELTAQQWAQLPWYPADGTNILAGGGVYRFAGGAPIFVSNWANVGGVQPVTVVDSYALDNPTTSGHLSHVRKYPADGTNVLAGGGVYRFAGGAPIFVSNWANVGGVQPVTVVDSYALDNPTTSGHLSHVRRYPMDNTFLRGGTTSGKLYRVVGGKAFHVSDCSPLGFSGCNMTFTSIDEAAIHNAGQPAHWSHLLAIPLDGTVVEAVPSGKHYRWSGGKCSSTATVTGVISVNDLAVTTICSPNVTFKDVPVGSTFFTEIEWAVSAGITSGYSNGTFRPAASINRDAVAAMLFRAMNPGAAKPKCTGAKPFTDVATSHQFCGEIAWMKSRGISNGNADGSYSPSAPVSRQAIAAFLARAWSTGPLPACNASLFTDVGPGNPFCKEITWMKQQGISNGWKVGSSYEFRPGASIERQAFVAFLHRKYG